MNMLRTGFISTLMLAIALLPTAAIASPPPETSGEVSPEIPEEVLRTELILEGRSPLDGSLLSPEDYAALEQQLTQPQNGPLPVSSELRSLVFQLKLLDLLKRVLPGF